MGQSMSPGEDEALCRRSLRAGSRSFDLAGRLLPRPLRADAAALYAFCRAADDAVDAPGPAGAERLARVRQALARATAGLPANPVERAFAGVLRRHSIPAGLPVALLEGFAWDVENRRYADADALVGYAMRVAGSVGVMMALLMGVRARAMLGGAADLGCAMQLTNIARDVGEDARLGRLYLPLDRLRARGLDPEAWRADPVPVPAARETVREVVELAAGFYRRAAPAIAGLPAACRPAIEAAGLLYGAIGDEVARRGYDSVTARAVVPPWRKALLAARWARALRRPPGELAQPLPAACVLLDLVPPVEVRGSVVREAGLVSGSLSCRR